MCGYLSCAPDDGPPPILAWFKTLEKSQMMEGVIDNPQNTPVNHCSWDVLAMQARRNRKLLPKKTHTQRSTATATREKCDQI